MPTPVDRLLNITILRLTTVAFLLMNISHRPTGRNSPLYTPGIILHLRPHIQHAYPTRRQFTITRTTGREYMSISPHNNQHLASGQRELVILVGLY